jgi:hypothetical protein
MARQQTTHLHTRRPQINPTDTVWFALMFLLLILSCTGAFLSFTWLTFAAASGTGLMPWLALFLISLSIIWQSSKQVDL